MDIEGDELLALYGMNETLNHHHPSLIIEIHSTSLENNCHAYLKNLGYKNIQIIESNTWIERIYPEVRPIERNCWILASFR